MLQESMKLMLSGDRNSIRIDIYHENVKIHKYSARPTLLHFDSTISLRSKTLSQSRVCCTLLLQTHSPSCF